MSSEIEPNAVPPVEPGEVLVAEETRWPKVIGIISLLYAIAGLLCTTFQGTWLAVAPFIPEMFRGGVDMPPVIRIVGGAQAVLVLCVGILMLLGAANLLRRRRAGVSALKKWVILRIALVILGMVTMVLTAPAQVHMQRTALDFRNDMLREAGQEARIQEMPDAALWRRVMINGSIFSGVLLVYPIFLGFWLARRKIVEEVAVWD